MNVKRRLPPLFLRRVVCVIAVFLMLLSLVAVVHAAPNITNCASVLSTSLGLATWTFSMNSFGGAFPGCAVNGNLFLATFYLESDATMTFVANSDGSLPTGITKACTTANNCLFTFYDYFTASTTASSTFTITLTAGHDLTGTTNFQFVIWEVYQGVSFSGTPSVATGTSAAGLTAATALAAYPANALVAMNFFNDKLSATTISGHYGGVNTFLTTGAINTANCASFCSGGQAFIQELGAGSNSNFGFVCDNSSGTPCNASYILVQVMVFSATGGAVVNSNGTQNVGFCPTKLTTTFTLANSTIYMYEAVTPAPETANVVSTFIASTVGSGPHTLRLLVYAQSAAGAGLPISATNPLVKQAEFAATYTSGTKNQPLSAALAISLAGNVNWAIGIVGDDHIKINQSSLTGLFTQTGNPSTQVQPSSFTSAGTTSTSQVFLCASATYQAITTTTSIGTITTTSTSFSTLTTAPNINSQISYDNLMLGVIVLLGPSLLIAGLTKQLWGGILGAVLGLAVGVYAGFLPLWTIAAVIIVCITALFFARQSGAGGGI